MVLWVMWFQRRCHEEGIYWRKEPTHLRVGSFLVTEERFYLDPGFQEGTNVLHVCRRGKFTRASGALEGFPVLSGLGWREVGLS